MRSTTTSKLSTKLFLTFPVAALAIMLLLILGACDAPVASAQGETNGPGSLLPIILMSADKPNAQIGDIVRFIVLVKYPPTASSNSQGAFSANSKNSAADFSGLKVTTTIGGEFSITAATTTKGAISTQGQEVTTTFDSLSPDEVVTITIDTKVVKTIPAEGSVSASVLVANMGDRTTNQSVRVIVAPLVAPGAPVTTPVVIPGLPNTGASAAPVTTQNLLPELWQLGLLSVLAAVLFILALTGWRYRTRK